MLKREIKYQDFEGTEVVETFYFNISQSELVELEVQYDEGLTTMLKNIVEAQDNKSILKQFKDILLLAYGVKSEDGRRFVKSPELREAFAQTAAYDALFMELVTNDEAATKFLLAVMPSNLTGGMGGEPAVTTENEAPSTNTAAEPAV